MCYVQFLLNWDFDITWIVVESRIKCTFIPCLFYDEKKIENGQKKMIMSLQAHLLCAQKSQKGS